MKFGMVFKGFSTPVGLPWGKFERFTGSQLFSEGTSTTNVPLFVTLTLLTLTFYKASLALLIISPYLLQQHHIGWLHNDWLRRFHYWSKRFIRICICRSRNKSRSRIRSRSKHLVHPWCTRLQHFLHVIHNDFILLVDDFIRHWIYLQRLLNLF